MSRNTPVMDGIAIIGMAGRFAQAKNLDEFWRNLCEGRECISAFSKEELQAAGVEPAGDDPAYIRSRAVLENADLFDAGFFGINPKEAEVMDPQHRVFLECAWEAMEDAGYDPAAYGKPVGVFAGMAPNSYQANNLMSRPDVTGMVGEYPVMLGNDKDYLPLRVSYKLNLRGPSLNIQTSCSTTLAAAAVACQNLLTHQCDLAITGGVSISFPQKRGHHYQEGGVYSGDGHCRAFDARATGTVAGEGAGVVILKRLADALADGDQVYAVIKGFAVNNDGAQKSGFTAPSVEGQAEAIAMAQAMAGAAPETISYVEAHGTGTPLGDPIEIEALTKAFRAGTAAKQFCGIGSLKTNIGHLDAAAGVASLIKVALALRHQKIPASLHFEAPNPRIDFANSPFRVNASLTEWKGGNSPRRAGINGFGIGGTNIHLILEEAPETERACEGRNTQLLVLSARSAAALEQATVGLAHHLEANPGINLADVAYTLQTGRRAFNHRRMITCRDVRGAVKALSTLDPRDVVTRETLAEAPSLVFMFPGQGAQEVNMGWELYLNEPVFREHIVHAAEVLRPILGCDLRTIVYPAAEGLEEARQKLTQTRFTQPALFMVEYALARLWESWGIHSEALIGHSVGEYVAACLAGVFSFEDALKLVALRAQLVQELPGGAMLAVRLTEQDAEPLLNGTFSLAAVNSAALCVISGPTGDIEQLQGRLTERGIAARRLSTSHAFHSSMMDAAVRPFTDLVRQVKRHAPGIPLMSTVTGRWMTEEQAKDPDYWATHLRKTVRFADGLGAVLKQPQTILLESGPGQTLSLLARQHPARSRETLVLSSLSRSHGEEGDVRSICAALGQLWAAGGKMDWQKFHGANRRNRVSLPAYPFERKRYWVEPGVSAFSNESASVSVLLNAAESADPARTVNPEVVPPVDAPEAVQITSTMDKLRKIFGTLSGANPEGVRANVSFIELGFDSLFLAQAAHAIEKQLGVKVAFRQLMAELSTLESLATHIDAKRPGGQPAVVLEPARVNRPSSKIVPVNRGEMVSLPLTGEQREFWFACQISDGASCAYNESRLLHFQGAFQPGAMRTAIQQLVDRHEALRTTIPNGSTQAIWPRMSLNVPLLDLSTLVPTDKAGELNRMEVDEANLPFDLVKGPLIRARLVRLAEDHHVLFLTIHHIICDGQAWGVLFKELSALYDAASQGVKCDLPEAMQMSRFVRLQAEERNEVERNRCEAYWQNRFAQGAPVLELPTDGTRPATWRFDGARETHVLGASLCDAMRQMGTQRGCTFFTTLLAAQYVLLHRLSGQEQIILGVPVADRAMDGGESIVGLCLNFLPVQAVVTGAKTFTNFLEETKAVFLEAFDHRHLAFGKLIQNLGLPRNPGRMPLVSATFNVERLGSSLEFAGVKTTVTINQWSASNFDLSFNLTEMDGELHLDCRYNRGLFSPQTIHRWLGYFETLLTGIARNPDLPIAELPVLSQAERSQILLEWNATRAGYPEEKCLHQLFEAQAARAPGMPAVELHDATLSYAELNRRANRLAHRLQSLGVGPDVPVGICLRRSLDLPVAVLAVLKAGGACVPMDPEYPRERLQLMLETSRAPVLITHQQPGDHLRAREQNVVSVVLNGEMDWNSGANPALDANPPNFATPRHLAYVIHTSGSTGVPKGVAMEHRSLVNLMEWQRQHSTVSTCGRTLQFASLSFDVSFQEMFSTWHTGGTLVLIDELMHRDAIGLVRLLHERRIERLFLPFVALQQLAEVMPETGPVPENLREVITAGEALQVTPAIVNLFSRLGNCTLCNQYGPSESHVVTAFTLTGAPETWLSLPPIGKPVANTQIYVLDAHGEPVPPGVPGQLFIGGDCLARGYLHRPDLTSERFVPNPFSANRADRLYRTGDLARWRQDGNVEFLGRMDQQVKIRGHRVELGEIETVLHGHESVKECAVVACGNDAGERYLAAYVVGQGGGDGTGATVLRSYMQAKLPAPMVPATFVFLDALPLTPSGKLDRRALPVSGSEKPAPARNLLAPRTETEEAIAVIWREVLGHDQVSVDDDFFDVGGHSLLMTRVLLRVADAFQVEIPLRHFFETPTIEGLAVAVEELVIEQIKQSGAEATRPDLSRSAS